MKKKINEEKEGVDEESQRNLLCQTIKKIKLDGKDPTWIINVFPPKSQCETKDIFLLYLCMWTFGGIVS